MKKIFTFFAATFLAAAALAADPRPNIKLSATNGVEVVIDGQSYFNNMDFWLSDRRGELHTIEVYAYRNSYSPYRNNRNSRNGDRLLGSATFRTNGEHLYISVGDYGEIVIENDREYAMRTGGYIDRDYGYSQRDNDYRNRDVRRDNRNIRDRDFGRDDRSRTNRKNRF